MIKIACVGLQWVCRAFKNKQPSENAALYTKSIFDTICAIFDSMFDDVGLIQGVVTLITYCT